MCEAWILCKGQAMLGGFILEFRGSFPLCSSGLCHPLDLKTSQVTGRLLTLTHIHSPSL